MTHTKHHWQYGTENEGYFIANGELRPDIAKQIQSEADARLIAAAPDLLEALRRVLPFVDCCAAITRDDIKEFEEAFKASEFAIAKATGEQS